MGQFIQIDPRMFDTGRGPRRRDLLGQALGGTIQNLANTYLQSKVQSMLEEKKLQQDLQVQQDSAIGLASLAPVEARPQIISSFSKLPTSLHTVQNLKTAIDLMGGGGQDVITSGFDPTSLGRKTSIETQTRARPQDQGQQIQEQEAPLTPQRIATNIAAMQRMGQGGLPMMPGVPQGQNFLPYEQQFQPAMGNAPAMALPQQMQPGQPPVMSTGEVAPRPAMNLPPETRSAPLAATAAAATPPTPEEQGRVALEDITPEEMNHYLRTSKESSERKREIKKAWDAVQKAKREERTVEAQERKVTGQDIERTRKLNEPVDNYFNKIAEEHRLETQKRVNLTNIAELSKKTGDSTRWKLGFAKMANIDPDLLLNRDEATIEKLSNDLLPAKVKEFAGQGARTYVSEVDAMIKAIPNLMQNPEGRITISRFIDKMYDLKDLEYNTANELRKEYKKSKLYPTLGDMQFELNERMAPESARILQEAAEIGRYGQVVKYKPDTIVDHMPKAADVPKGWQFEYEAAPGEKPLYPPGTIVESDGRKWIKIEKR